MKNKLKNAGIALPLVALASAGVVQTAAAATVDELDQRIRILERQLELQKEDSETKAKDASVVSASDKGFSFKNAKGDYEIKLGALIQADARWYTSEVQPGAGPVDTFTFRRVEPTIQGSLGKLIGFRFTPAFGSGTSFDTTDIYADLKFHPAAWIRAGKFKEPVGLENLQSSGALTFAERGLTINLVPNRDLGVQLAGDFAGGTTSYAIGVFNGSSDRADAPAADTNDSKEYAARIFSEPFKNSPGFLQGLGIGLAGTYANDDFNPLNNAATALGNGRSPGQLAIFAYEGAVAAAGAVPALPAATASGEHSRIVPQAYWYRNNLSALAEYVINKQELTRGSNTSDLEHDAWQLQLGYVLTGEDASYKGVKPKTPFKTGEAGWGAFEIALRYGVLDFDDDAFLGASTVAAGGSAATTSLRLANPTSQVSEAQAAGLALNWYLTSNAKLALNYEHTTFEGGGGGTAAAPLDRPDEDVVIGRVQLNF
ncbi:MAG TPA: porin [Solimonas sp.]|nr:porin [Solimonas sp.]